MQKHILLGFGWALILSAIELAVNANQTDVTEEAKGAASQKTTEPTKDSKELSAEFASIALEPFWSASTLRESMFFLQADEASSPTSSLLFRPEKIIRVTSATREFAYEAGRDYVIDPATGAFTLPKGSRISFKTADELYPLMTSTSPKIARQAGDKTRGIFFDNAAGYHQLQVEVTYTCAPGQWKGFVPKYAGGELPRTMAILKAKKPLSVMLCGDSISAGYNASKFTKAKPGCPAFGEMVALAIEKHFGSKVAFTNHAVSGWNAAQGLKHGEDANLGAKRPDLVIIAFGMNDVFARNASAYQKNVRGIMDAIHKESPGTEFILVASMLGNAEWGMPMEEFPRHRDALAMLCGPGIVLADLTSIWDELLKHKSFYDLTGNGVNHPNDFGHGVYAQVIMALLVEPKRD
jgi:acyl-CoA thioesterase-1